jgi:hypothetical protein
MKRFVGPALAIIGLLLACTWAAAFPESEPELGAAALLLILEILGVSVALSVETFDTRH